MKRTKWLILCLVLCMAATLGGTIAYLTDSDGDVNVMVLGNVSIDLIEEERDGDSLRTFTDDKMMLPVVGQITNDGAFGMPANPNFLDKIVRVECTSSNANAYLRVYLGLPSALRDIQPDTHALHMLTGENVALPGNYTDSWSWTEKGVTRTTIDGIPFDMYCFEYQKLLEPGELTPPVLAGLWLDSRLDSDDQDPFRYVMNVNGEEISLEYDFSIGLQVPVLVLATQADGFTSADAAFQAAGMDEPAFDELLNLNISGGNNGEGGGSILSDLLNLITAAWKAGDDRADIQLTADVFPLSDPDFAAQLGAMSNALGTDTEINIQPQSPDGSLVMVELGKTSLPENFMISVPSGQPMVITGEDFD